MDYISKLNDEEFEVVCQIIGAKKIKKFFQQNSRLLGKIKSGFRANSLSDTQAINLLVQNREKGSIYNFTNEYIECAVSNIINGQSTDEIAEHLAKSPFANHLDLYIKLKHTELQMIPKECLVLMKNGIDNYTDKQDSTTNEEHSESEMEECQWEIEVDALKRQIEDLEIRLQQCESERNEERSAYKKCAEKYETDIYALENKLHEKENEVQQARLTIERQKAELDELKSPAEESADDLQDGEFRCTSLCIVEDSDGFNDAQRLVRLADVIDDKLKPFYFNREIPACFENRKFLYWYWRHEPKLTVNLSNKDFAIWDWNAVNSKDDPSSDYNQYVRFQPFLSPIEMFELSENSIDSVKKALLSGISMIPCCKRIIFYISLSEQSKIGLLCEDSQLESKDGKSYLKADVFSLKQYEFTAQDIVLLDGKEFYKFLKIGRKFTIIPIKDPLEAVRDLVLDKAVWNTFKQREVAKKDWQVLKEFLLDIPSTNVYQDIIQAYGCDEEQAAAYVEQFIQQVHSYINATDIEDEVLAAAIENHSELFERCNSIAEKNWENSNQQKIQEAQREQEELQHQNKEQQEKLADAKRKLDKINAEFSEKEQLARSVDDKVTAKIEEARKNAADFISEMAFRFPTRQTPQSNSVAVQYHKGTVLGEDMSDTYSTWEELLDIIAGELKAAGVARNYKHGVAAYMYSAYINKTPLLLAGPNAVEISNAFSAAMFGKTADYIDCMDGYSADIVKQILESNELLIILNSPFENEWISRIPGILMNAQKHIILTHPFAEDVQIEPKGLFNYCLPVLTELFVDDMPEREYFGGRMSKGFVEYLSTDKKSFHNRLLKTMRVGALTRTRLQQLLTDMHIIGNMGEKTIDANNNDYLLGLIPYAYVTGNVDIIRDKIKGTEAKDMPLSKDMRDLLLSFLGDEV